MYGELVKELRDSAEWADRLALLMGRAEGDTHAPIMRKAADAIEDFEFACNRYEKDYKALCEYLPKWIPVMERCPEAGERVLCYCRANIYEVMKMRTDGDWVYDMNHVYMHSFVTHWMPLPQAPKEEN